MLQIDGSKPGASNRGAKDAKEINDQGPDQNQN